MSRVTRCSLEAGFATGSQNKTPPTISYHTVQYRILLYWYWRQSSLYHETIQYVSRKHDSTDETRSRSFIGVHVPKSLPNSSILLIHSIVTQGIHCHCRMCQSITNRNELKTLSYHSGRVKNKIKYN